jgi:hypothetical protein
MLKGRNCAAEAGNFAVLWEGINPQDNIEYLFKMFE